MDSQVSLLLYTKFDKNDFINERTYSIRRAEYRRSLVLNEDSKPEEKVSSREDSEVDDDLNQVYSISAMLADHNYSATDSPATTSCLSLPRQKMSKFYARLRQILVCARLRLAERNIKPEARVKHVNVVEEYVGGGGGDISKSIEDVTQLLKTIPSITDRMDDHTTPTTTAPSAEGERTLKYNVSRRSVYDAENRLLSRFDDEFKRLSSRRRRRQSPVRRPASALPLLNNLAKFSISSSRLPTEPAAVELSTTWPLSQRPFSWDPSNINSTVSSTEDSYYFGFCSFCGTTFDDEVAFEEHVSSRCLVRERMNATTEMSGISWDDVDFREGEEEEEQVEGQDARSCDESNRGGNYTLNDVSIGHTTFCDADLEDDADADNFDDAVIGIHSSRNSNDSCSCSNSNASSTEVVTLHSGSWSGNWPRADEVVADFVEISLISESDREESYDRSESATSGYITLSNFSASDAGTSNIATPRTTPSCSPVEHSDQVFTFDTYDVKEIVPVYIASTYL